MKKRINEIADVQTGFQFRQKLEADPGGTHWVVQAKDIDADQGRRLDTADLWKVVPPRNADKDLLQEGDVLYLAKGRRNYATPVESVQGASIAAAYFFVLRLHSEDIRPDYLAWYINQPPARSYLADFFRGTGIPFIRMDDFTALEVCIPPLSVQKQIVALHELSLRESSLLRQLETKRSQLIRGVCLAAARTDGCERSE